MPGPAAGSPWQSAPPANPTISFLVGTYAERLALTPLLCRSSQPSRGRPSGSWHRFRRVSGPLIADLVPTTVLTLIHRDFNTQQSAIHRQTLYQKKTHFYGNHWPTGSEYLHRKNHLFAGSLGNLRWRRFSKKLPKSDTRQLTGGELSPTRVLQHR